MKSQSLQSLIEASNGPFYEPPKWGFGKFVLGAVAGAAVTVASLYFAADKSQPEPPKNNIVAENPAEKNLLEEISRYKTTVSQKEAELAKSNKDAEDYRKKVAALAKSNEEVKNYKQKVVVLEDSVSRLTQSVNAQNGSGDEKNAEIASLNKRLDGAEKQSKELSQKVAEYEKSVSNAFTDAREKDAQLTALQSRFTDMQKQAGALAEEVQKYRSQLDDERRKYGAASEKLTDYNLLAMKVADVSLKLNKLSEAGKLISVRTDKGEEAFVPESEMSANKSLLGRINENSKGSFGGSYTGTCTMHLEKDCFKELPYRHITEIHIRGGPSLGRASGTVSLTDLGSKLPYVEALHIENTCIDSANGFENFESLKELNIVNCNVESAAGFEKIKNLKVLVLAGNNGIWNTEENTKYIYELTQKGVEVIIAGEDYQKWCERKR